MLPLMLSETEILTTKTIKLTVFKNIILKIKINTT